MRTAAARRAAAHPRERNRTACRYAPVPGMIAAICRPDGVCQYGRNRARPAAAVHRQRRNGGCVAAVLGDRPTGRTRCRRAEQSRRATRARTGCCGASRRAPVSLITSVTVTRPCAPVNATIRNGCRQADLRS